MIETRQRGEVIDALRSGDALAAQELHSRLRSQGSGIGLATVYRTLRRLVNEGMVDVIRDDPIEARYRLCSPDHHHHLLCESCGKVAEIPECDLETWAARVADDHGFTLTDHRAEIIGLCEPCAAERNR